MVLPQQPTATFGDFGSTVTKFGISSLHSYLGRGEENSYLLTGTDGTVELFFYAKSLPDAGNQSLLLTGGDSDKNTMIFGLNENGKIVYSFGNNDGQPQKVLENTQVSGNNWHHLIVGHDNGSIFSYFDSQKGSGFCFRSGTKFSV